jgi:hypothetical protein
LSQSTNSASASANYHWRFPLAGYTAREWKSLGWSYPNPAFMNNRQHSFLALGAERTGSPHLEDGEDLETSELTPAEIRQALQTDRMRNANTLLALSRVFDLREQ